MKASLLGSQEFRRALRIVCKRIASREDFHRDRFAASLAGFANDGLDHVFLAFDHDLQNFAQVAGANFDRKCRPFRLRLSGTFDRRANFGFCLDFDLADGLAVHNTAKTQATGLSCWG